MNTFCRYYNSQTCSSCQLINTEYQHQLADKEKVLWEQGIEAERLLPSVPSLLTGFRHKAKLVVTGDLSSPLLGLAGEEDLDRGREILECPLHHSEINRLILDLPVFIKEAKLLPYQIHKRIGELKGIIIFYSSTSNEMYLRFILRSKESLDRIKKHLPLLQQKFPNLKCITANIQPIPHAILEGEEEVFLTTRMYVHHKLENVSLHIDPRGFVQTNEKVAAALYQEAAEWIHELHAGRFCELFSGQGAFSFAAAMSFKKGMGIEVNKEAVDSANATAAANNFTHLRFQAADAASVRNELLEFGPEVLLVNPPRRGLAGALPLIEEAAPPAFIYSSCSHETLTKDLKKLSHLYRVEKVRIFDMFPHTRHFETLVLLKKR